LTPAAYGLCKCVSQIPSQATPLSRLFLTTKGKKKKQKYSKSEIQFSNVLATKLRYNSKLKKQISNFPYTALILSKFPALKE